MHVKEYLLSFVETPRTFIIAELSIRKLGSSSVLVILIFISANNNSIISTDEDPSLRIESSAIINLRGVSTKLNKYIVFTMQTYKKLMSKSVFTFQDVENASLYQPMLINRLCQ